jgi:hypothetical protein
MAEIINLNRARKARDKAQKAQDAKANRAQFGRGKAEKTLTAAEREAAERRLDGAHLAKERRPEGAAGDDD